VSKASAFALATDSAGGPALASASGAALAGTVLGWVSAAMYLLARIPQIVRNVRFP
jgi:hypothetical protein